MFAPSQFATGEPRFACCPWPFSQNSALIHRLMSHIVGVWILPRLLTYSTAETTGQDTSVGEGTHGTPNRASSFPPATAVEENRKFRPTLENRSARSDGLAPKFLADLSLRSEVGFVALVVFRLVMDGQAPVAVERWLVVAIDRHKLARRFRRKIRQGSNP